MCRANTPDKMTTSSTSLFLTSANSQEYWRTASAVPWNHSVPPVPGVCVAASTWHTEALAYPRTHALGSGAHLHEAVAAEADAVTEVVGARHVAVQRRGVELRGA